MGDPRLIPLSDPIKHKADFAAIGTTALAYFKAIPWPELAAAMACLYTALRILELLWGWVRGKE